MKRQIADTTTLNDKRMSTMNWLLDQTIDAVNISNGRFDNIEAMLKQVLNVP
jgi:hypothetical protein